MLPTSQAQRTHELLAQKGIVRPVDLEAIGIPRAVLTRMAAAGEVERIGRGLYRLPTLGSEHDSLIAVATKVPQAVFCLLPALQCHGLPSPLPRQIWIAMPRGSHTPRIDYPPIKMVQFAGDAYSTGIEEVERDRTTVRIYCVAKTIADCFKHRSKIGLDVALEALKETRKKGKASADDLWHYAKLCRVANVMRPYLEAIE